MDHAHGAAANAEGADEHQQNAEPEAFEKYLSNHSCFSFCFDCCVRGDCAAFRKMNHAMLLRLPSCTVSYKLRSRARRDGTVSYGGVKNFAGS